MAVAKRIVITGAGGFVGGHLISVFSPLVSAGEVELITPGLMDQPPIDVTDRDAVIRLVASARPDAIIHLAAIAFPAAARRDPERAWRVNVDGTLNLARAILCESPATRLVFAGSSESYGASFKNSDGPVKETTALAPMTAYAASKAASDVALGQMAYDGLDVVRFRPFNQTGPGQIEDYVVPAFARQVADIVGGRRDPWVEVGNLDVVRDFLDVRDVVRAYIAAATGVDETRASGQAVNLASGTGRAIRDVLDMLIRIARADRDIDVAVRVDPARVRPVDVPYALGDNRQACDLFGWKPEIPFEKTLADVLDALQRETTGQV